MSGQCEEGCLRAGVLDFKTGVLLMRTFRIKKSMVDVADRRTRRLCGLRLAIVNIRSQLHSLSISGSARVLWPSFKTFKNKGVIYWRDSLRVCHCEERNRDAAIQAYRDYFAALAMTEFAATLPQPTPKNQIRCSFLCSPQCFCLFYTNIVTLQPLWHIQMEN